MDELKAFKAEIDAFLAKHDMAPATFGAEACNDTAFVTDLRDGREPRFSTIAKVRAFMADYEARDGKPDVQALAGQHHAA